MENRRFILIALLGVVLFFLYQAWQKDHPPSSAAAPAVLRAETPAAVTDEPAPRAASSAAATDAPTVAPTVATTARPAGGDRVRVETDRYVAEIALMGGDLRRLELKGYPISKDRPQENFALLDEREGRYYVLQSGIAGTEAALVTAQTPFAAAQRDLRLVEGADAVELVLTHIGNDGLQAEKRYRFHRASYRIDLEQGLKHSGGAALTVSPYVRFARSDFKTGDEPPFTEPFNGVGVYQQKEGSSDYAFKKTSLEDLEDEPVELKQSGGWIALLQSYFVSAILPPPGEALRFSAKPSATQGYIAQYVGAPVELAPGAEQRFSTGLYIGPKLQDSIGAAAKGLELSVDYGILTPIAEPLFWLLEKLERATGNWGWAIILLTLIVKGAMYKLSEAQYRSMARMKKFAPKLQDIKERYGDDRERMQKAMMELYKKEGFNPLAGCWPLLLQFPVFIALYWVLLQSVELRQAPFVLWLQDLTAPDPFFVLPLLFGATMFVQQKLSGNQAMDPMQQRVMNVMPIAMTAFFAFFQSGLVLYWVTSNLVGISQQWYITRKLAREEELKLAKR